MIIKNPLVSVVIPTYNHEKYIAESIESLLAQSFRNFEIVIVNDGSSDRTEEIIKSFKDPRINSIFQENQGPSIATNTGIIQARGKYIALLAGDDVCHPNRLERQIETCEKIKNGVIFSICEFFDEDSNILEINHKSTDVFKNSNLKREAILHYLFFNGNYFVSSSVFAEKIVFLEGGLFNPLYLQLQDFDMWIRLLLKKYQLFIIQEKLVKYRIRRDNLNLSGEKPEMWRRLGFEFAKVLRNYLEINSVEELLNIFPEAEIYGKVHKDLIPYFIARLAIDHDPRSPIYPVHQYFGLSVLSELLGKKECAQKLERECGFKYTHFYELLGRYDLFGLEAKNSDSHIKKNIQWTEKDKKIKDLTKELDYIRNSRAWKFGNKLERFIQFFIPKNTVRKRVYEFLLRKINIFNNEGRERNLKKSSGKNYSKHTVKEDLYAIWILKNEPNQAQLKEFENESRSWENRPKISIIVPVYNPEEYDLSQCIQSVLNQSYDNWELCIVDGGSIYPYVKEINHRFAGKDPRIQFKTLTVNQGIAGNSNEALKLATGEFVGFLDHDDMLAPFALYEVVKALNEDPGIDFLFSDEDKIPQDNGKRYAPFFKPEFAPDTLLSYNYMCHFAVVRKSILDEIGGFREGFDGAQDYDLFLRIIQKTQKIKRIPKILYHWRASEGSLVSDLSTKPGAPVAAKKAIQEFLVHKGLEAEVLDGLFPTSYRVKYKIKSDHIVSIIIPTKDNPLLLKRCVSSVLNKTGYKNFEIVIVDNRSQDPEACEFLKAIQREPKVKVVQYDLPFNFSSINNYAASLTGSAVILLLNNDTEVIGQEWLSAMLEFAQRKEVGAVGAKLYYPNDTIQHAGIFLGPGWVNHSHKKFPRTSHGNFGRINIIQNVSAVTGACMMVRKEVFEEVGGFDETLSHAYNDVDFCLKIREKGYRIVYTPYAELYHHESASRGYENTPERKERFLKEQEILFAKWKHIIEPGDPYYNPNLTLEREDFSLKF